MLTVTDNEMQQVEQELYQILLQRSCTQATPLRTFHQEEKCLYCGKTIYRASNLEKYLRSCETALTHPVKHQLHQAALGELT